MCYPYAIPQWFAGFDAAVEVVLVVLGLLIFLYALEVYRRVNIPKVRLLAMAYGSLAAAYAVQAFHNATLFIGGYSTKCPPVSFLDTYSLTALVTLIFIMLSMAGILMLLNLTMKTQSMKPFWILWIVSLFAILSNFNMIFTFYVLATFYLVLIAIHFARNYIATQKSFALMVATAFILFALSWFQFLLALGNPTFYVSAHLFGIVAFVLILINLIQMQYGQKTR